MNYMQSIISWLLKLAKKRSTFVVLGLYTLVAGWFYGETFISQLVFDRSQSGWEVIGEIRASEWGIEKVLGKLEAGISPFSRISEIVYPFGIDIVASDVGLAFLVWPFTSILSTHQALMLITVLGLIAAGMGMYLLLREMGVSIMIAFVMGLAFENNTFLLPRVGHLGYLATFFVLPWNFYLWRRFTRSKEVWVKLVISIIGALLYLFTLWLNFYYFMILNLGIGALIGYQLVTGYRRALKFVKQNIAYILVAVNTLILASWQWVKTLLATIKFSEISRPLGWGGAIEFSSDVINMFIPSQYNYYYGQVIAKLGSRVEIVGTIFEDYNYPGILILLSLGAVGYLLKRNKQDKSLSEILPYWLTALFFLVLTWGPFLQIAGKMFIELEEEIRVVLPLPFALLHYLPYLNNLRAPGRLAMGMVFFGTIVAGLLLEKYVKKFEKSKRFRLALLIALVVIVDQRPVEMQLEPVKENYPQELYKYVADDEEEVSVIMIPFTVRDGLTWFGDYNSVYIDYIQRYLDKPIIGGYTGRIPDYAKEYYRSNQLVGKLGRVIDTQLATNPFMLNIPERDPWQEDLELARETTQILEIKYAVVKSDASGFDQSQKAKEYLEKVGYKQVMSEGEYLLYEIEIEKEDYLSIELGSERDHLQLGMGWWSRGNGYRWGRAKSSVFVKNSEPGNYQLTISGSSYYRRQDLSVYIDEQLMGVAKMGETTETKDWGTVNLEPGIHIIHFIWEEEYKPFEVLPGSLDARELGGQFSQIKLTKVE